jgi:hypothetical protein
LPAPASLVTTRLVTGCRIWIIDVVHECGAVIPLVVFDVALIMFVDHFQVDMAHHSGRPARLLACIQHQFPQTKRTRS